MRLLGDGKHGQAERIQTFRGLACHTTFSARRNTPLYRLKTPSHQIAMVLTALAEGLILRLPSASSAFDTPPSRVGCPVQAIMHKACTSASSAICISHTCCFDELRTRLRCAKQILWLWLVIDPRTKILPMLQLGPRTQHMAHMAIHALRESLAAFLPSAFHQ